MHWSEVIADALEKRGGPQVIETGTSISGIPHVGNASDIIRGDAVRKAVNDRDMDVELIWVADDSDPFRSVPEGMDMLNEYLGFPVHDIPDPNGCHANFVEHYVSGFMQDLTEYGVEPTVYSSRELYKDGAFVEEINIVLESRDKVVEILNRFRRTPLSGDFIPWDPICTECGRISTTRAVSWDGDIVNYVCEDVQVKGGLVKGCGVEEESSISLGEGKLPWRVEWPARWRHFQVTCEPFGKEHATAGGSYTTGKLLSEQVFDWPAPEPVIYEFFTLNGDKISSSKGNVITLRDWLEIAEPEVLKYFMYKRLAKQRDINLSMVSNLADEYDEAERAFFGDEEAADKSARMYELAQVGEPAELGVPYTLCAVLYQVLGDDVDAIRMKLESMGYEYFDLDRLRRRVRVAGNWLKAYGPEYLRFELLDDPGTIRAELSQLQGKALRMLAAELDFGWTPLVLHKRLYEISRDLNLEPQEFFKAIYLSLIGREKGPKAAAFILALDREFVIERFNSF